MPVSIRAAQAADVAFLTEMSVVAAFWRPDGHSRVVADVLRNPELARYIEGWPRPGDLGVIAEDDIPIGAAWLRFFPATDPGYGFVDDTIPELGIGVVGGRRGQGIGGLLLDALLSAARHAGSDAVSLSVANGNGARRLYERHGFQPVGEAGGSVTMVLRLAQ